MTDTTFAGLGLADPLLRAISDTGYTEPTPVQTQAIPMIIEGGDLLAAAQTGTGKTAGFTLPLLHRLAATRPADQKAGRPRCLILTPTRELAAQVEQSVQTYGKHLPLKSMVMFGGVSINPQIKQLKGPIDILVATPGRLLDHVGQRTIDLSGVEILVLDEADRMLDMGFIRDIRRILALLPKERQNLLFSATFSEEIRQLANGLLKDPGCVEVARRNTASELVAQAAYAIGQKQKRELLAHLIKQHQWFQVLVFTRTKHGANKLAEYLVKQDIPAMAIHGNKSQSARTRALAQFKDGDLPVLVATDIAARGLDIDQLPHVVNFELPNISEDYVHRIGRTGRAGTPGEAISLVDGDEFKYLTAIERLIRRKIERRELPEDFVPSANGSDPASEPRAPRQPRKPRKPRREGEARKGGDSRGNDARGNRQRQPGNEAGANRPRKGKQNGNTAPKAQAKREVDGNRISPQQQRRDDGEEINFNRLDIDPTGRRVKPQRPDADGNRAPAPGERRGKGGGQSAGGKRRSRGGNNAANGQPGGENRSRNRNRGKGGGSRSGGARSGNR